MDKETKTTQLELGETQLTSLYMMKELAKNDTDLSVDSDSQVEKTKMFYVMYARHTLNRIIKLTTFLEKLEDKFITAVDDIIDKQPESISIISTAMETISELLKDCNAVVKDVLKDDRLNNVVINNTQIINPNGTAATIIDADSRDEIRNLASSLLAQLEKIKDDETEVIDIEVDEEKKGD